MLIGIVLQEYQRLRAESWSDLMEELQATRKRTKKSTKQKVPGGNRHKQKEKSKSINECKEELLLIKFI